MLYLYGFAEKAEALLKSIGDASLGEVLQRAQSSDVPKSQWPRVVAVYEQMHKEAGDPFERLRLLHVLQEFGGADVANKMKAELEALGPDQLKPGDNQKQIRWALKAARLQFMEAIAAEME